MSEPATSSPRRRLDDATIILFGGARSAVQGIAADLGTFHPTPEQLENAAFLIDLGDGDALVVPAADGHLLPRGEGGEDLRGRAGAMVLAMARERDWTRRRLRMPDFLLSYAEALNAAAREADVYEALRATSVPVVGAYAAVVFVAVEPGKDAALHPLGGPALALAADPLPAECARLCREQRLVTGGDIAADPDGPLAPLAGLLDGTAAAQLLCAPVGAEALLVLLERRRDRVLTGEDRGVLAALVRQAEAALRRIVSERRVSALLGVRSTA